MRKSGKQSALSAGCFYSALSNNRHRNKNKEPVFDVELGFNIKDRLNIKIINCVQRGR
jgi:hypothetical protein